MSASARSSPSDDARQAIDCGAQYLVTPTMNLPVVRLAVERQIAIFPGGLTPTELGAGWYAGATAVKIFPAQTVGAAYLKHLRGPFPDCRPYRPAEWTWTQRVSGWPLARSRSALAGRCSATP